MPALHDLGQTLWLLTQTGWRFKHALETPLMVEVGAFPGLAYHAIVALWMDFAQIDKTELWERRAFELFGLLSEYSMAIDCFVDTAEGGQQCLAAPAWLKRHPNFRRYVSALACQIREKRLPQPVRRELLHTIQTYRYAARTSLLRALQVGPFANVEAVLCHKEVTSGAAFSTCVDLLSITHELDPVQRARLSAGFTAWGMSLQVTDDLRDLATDYGRVQNIVASILLTQPQEQARLEAAEMRSDKLPYLAPETYAQVKLIFNHYLTQVQLAKLTGRPLQHMLAVARFLFWLGTTNQSARVFRSYVSIVLRALGSHNVQFTHHSTSPILGIRSLTDVNLESAQVLNSSYKDEL